MNVCFNIGSVEPRFKISDDKANFWYMCYHGSDQDVKRICDWDSDFKCFVVSPIKLFKEFADAGELFLKKRDNKLSVEITQKGVSKVYRFRAKSKIGAPWTVKYSRKGIFISMNALSQAN